MHGRRAVVRLADGSSVDALIGSRALTPVAGDRVDIEVESDPPGLCHIHPRQGCLWRHDTRRHKRLLASHVDRMLVVAAPKPGISAEQLDRYLAISAIDRMPASIVRHKADLPDPALDARLNEFRALGYPVLTTSAQTDAGLTELVAHIGRGTAVFVGLSGAGKSSLTGRLIPAARPRTGTLSTGSGEGRHTTTTTRLYPLPAGGAVLDSPGVRDIRLWPMAASELIHGFPELARAAEQCRFRDCAHDGEPRCAVAQGVAAGTISKRRLASFRHLARYLASA